MYTHIDTHTCRELRELGVSISFSEVFAEVFCRESPRLPFIRSRDSPEARLRVEAIQALTDAKP